MGVSLVCGDGERGCDYKWRVEGGEGKGTDQFVISPQDCAWHCVLVHEPRSGLLVKVREMRNI